MQPVACATSGHICQPLVAPQRKLQARHAHHLISCMSISLPDECTSPGVLGGLQIPLLPQAPGCLYNACRQHLRLQGPGYLQSVCSWHHVTAPMQVTWSTVKCS